MLNQKFRVYKSNKARDVFHTEDVTFKDILDGGVSKTSVKVGGEVLEVLAVCPQTRVVDSNGDYLFDRSIVRFSDREGHYEVSYDLGSELVFIDYEGEEIDYCDFLYLNYEKGVEVTLVGNSIMHENIL